MTKWLRLGLIYGVVGVTVGMVMAAAGHWLLVPLLGRQVGLMVEIALAALAVVASGLVMMRRAGPWTTNSAVYFGMTGAMAAIAIGMPIDLLGPGPGLAESISASSLRHGTSLPVALGIMAFGPAILTQRA